MGEPHPMGPLTSNKLTDTSALELYRPRACTLPERLHLRSLVCDADSLERCINVYLGLEVERTRSASTPGSLTNLEKLDLSIGDNSEQDAHIPLLKQTAGLRDLTITSTCPPSPRRHRLIQSSVAQDLRTNFHTSGITEVFPWTTCTFRPCTPLKT